MKTSHVFDALGVIEIQAEDTRTAIRNARGLVGSQGIDDPPLARDTLGDVQSLVLHAQLRLEMTAAGLAELSAQLRQATMLDIQRKSTDASTRAQPTKGATNASR